MLVLRASIAAMPNVPNAKYLAHLAHQTQKTPFIRCSKSYYFCHMWTVPSQICHCTDSCGISFYYFLFHFLSHLSISLTLKPQSSPLKPHFVSRPRRLHAHQDADVRHSVLRLQRSDPVAYRTRFLLRPRVHQDRAWEMNRLPARRWCKSDFQHDQADDRVD